MASADEAPISKTHPGILQKPPGFRYPAAPARQPPRTAPLPPTFRRAGKAPLRRRRSICRLLCCFAVVFTVCFLFLIALAGAVAYLYFQPRLPLFRLQAVQVPRFNATTRSDGSGTFVDAATVVKIFASNQNGKISLSYGASNAAVYVSDEDGDVGVGSGSMPGFVQGRGSATVMRLAAEAKGVLVDDAVGARLRGRFKSKEIRFGVQVRTGVGVGVGGKMTGRVPIRVDCRPVSLKRGKAGGMLPKCEIYLFRWLVWRAHYHHEEGLCNCNCKCYVRCRWRHSAGLPLWPFPPLVHLPF